MNYDQRHAAPTPTITPSSPLQLGDLAIDMVTGFKGIVIARLTFLHGCDRLWIQPRGTTADGKPLDDECFDDQRLAVVDRAMVPHVKIDEATIFPMGARAKDTLTGFSGRIAAVQRHLSGGVFYTVEPEGLDEKGGLRKSESFEKSRLTVVEDLGVPQSPNADTKKRGGPQRHDALINR